MLNFHFRMCPTEMTILTFQVYDPNYAEMSKPKREIQSLH